MDVQNRLNVMNLHGLILVFHYFQFDSYMYIGGQDIIPLCNSYKEFEES